MRGVHLFMSAHSCRKRRQYQYLSLVRVSGSCSERQSKSRERKSGSTHTLRACCTIVRTAVPVRSAPTCNIIQM